jgi:hypothetical protein
LVPYYPVLPLLYTVGAGSGFRRDLSFGPILGKVSLFLVSNDNVIKILPFPKKMFLRLKDFSEKMFPLNIGYALNYRLLW